MSLLQKAMTHSIPIIEARNRRPLEEKTESPSVIPRLPSHRFVLIYSSQISKQDLTTLNFHTGGLGVIQYSPETFNGSVLDIIDFNYCIFNISKEPDLKYIQANISTWQDYVIVISHDEPETNDWVKVLEEGGYLTNRLKRLPQGNVNKSVFDSRLLHSVHIPHRKGFCARLRHKMTPECIANLAGTVAEVAVLAK